MINHQFVTIRTLLNKVSWFPTYISNMVHTLELSLPDRSFKKKLNTVEPL